jgi:heme a synthase
MGYLVAVCALALGLVALGLGAGAARWIGAGVGALALLQAALGIQTVISAAPLGLSLAHQAGAAMLWMATVVCARAAWR